MVQRMTARNRWDAIAAFERELIAFGLILPSGGVIADGTIHRLDDGQHHRKRNGAAWYVLNETTTGLLVGRAGSWWRDRGSFKWNSRGEANLRPADRKAIAELERKVEAARAEHYRQGAERAAAIWAAGEPCTTHPYLTRKGVKSHGLRVDHAGRLLVPVRDLDGDLRGVQRIDAKGEKRFTFGTDRQRPTCFVIGNIDEADTVAVGEGYASSATGFAATSWPVVVAFDAGGLEKIARVLRQRLPKATLVFLADHDLEEKGGTGQAKAKRAARAAGGVVALPPAEGHDWNDHAAEHGLDDVRARLIAAAGNYELPPTVTLAEGTARLDAIIGGFFAEARAWYDLPEDQRPIAPAHLANGTMGAGKSHIARRHGGKLLADQDAAVTFALPLHRLTREQAADFKAETGLDAAIWRGMDQPDPERDDGKAMCLEPELSGAALDAGLPATVACKVCPSRGVCGYRRQQGQTARAWFSPHNLIFQPKPKAIPAPAALVIDEKFHDKGMAEDIRLAASTLEGDLLDVPHAGDRALLSEYRGMLLAALKASGATVQAPEERARLTRMQLEAVGLTADRAQDARRIEWTRKPEPKLSGDVADMVRQLRALSSRFTSKVPTLWKLVEALLRGDHDQATTIEIEADAALQGGDGRGLLVRMHHRLDVHESWRVPTLILDGTAKPEIVRHWFPDLVALPEIHIEAPNQHVTWVRTSFAKDRLVPKDPAKSRNPEATKRYNKARLNNVEELRRYIEVQAARYRTGRNEYPVDVLVVTYKGAEELLKAGPLPANVAVEHFNNLRGSNAYQNVRAVIVVGRPLPDEAEIHRQAERMAGRPLDQGDPLVQAVRWSICEAELLQVIARGRAIRRTEADPLDVLLLGDVPLPLKIDTVASWEQAKPAPLELMAARGVVPACDPNRPGYWPLVAAMLPDVFKDVQAAKDYAKGSQWNLSIGTISIDGFHREPAKAKPYGARYAVPVLVDPGRRLDLATILDLSFDPLDPPLPRSPARAPVPAPAPANLPATVPAKPTGQFLKSIEGGGFAANSEITAAPKAAARYLKNNHPKSEPAAFAKVDASSEWPTPSLPPEASAAADFLNSTRARGGFDLPAAFSGQYAREADPMPDLARDRLRAFRRAAGVTQHDMAELAGIARCTLANFESGRFGLSPDAAARLRAVVAALPVVQAALF